MHRQGRVSGGRWLGSVLTASRAWCTGALSGVVCGVRTPLGIRALRSQRVRGIWGERKRFSDRGEAVERCAPPPGRSGQRPERRGRQAAQRGKCPETRRHEPGVRGGARPRERIASGVSAPRVMGWRGRGQRWGQPDGPLIGHHVPSPHLSVLLSDTWIAGPRVQSARTVWRPW